MLLLCAIVKTSIVMRDIVFEANSTNSVLYKSPTTKTVAEKLALALYAALK